MAHLQAAEREIGRAREELGAERNCCIAIQDTFTTTVKAVMNKKVVEAMELARI